MEILKKILLTVAVCVQVTSQQSTEPTIQIPKPTISLNPTHNVLYSTETVTLHCEVPKGASELQYDWYKDSAKLETDHQSRINVTNGGIYKCKAKTGSSESIESDGYKVTLEDLPEAQVESDRTEAFPGEKVSLQCVIPKSENWVYMWYQDSEKIDPTDETIIKDNTLTLSVKSSHRGKYVCQAELKDRTVKTAKSKTHFFLTVHEPPQPKLSIGSQWKTFYANEKVTLECSIDGDSNEWAYEWFKDGTPLSAIKDISFSGNTLSISSARASHSGQYSCRGKHRERTPVTTKQADALKLQIDDDTPKPDIRKDQWFEPFYTGEKIQLGCNMPGDGWKYDWYKGSKHLIRDSTFTINSVSPSNTGDYHCTAKRGDFPVDSETLQLRVEEPPQPKLSIGSQWKTFYPNEKVTLKCSIDGDSNEWDYEWFKDGTPLSANTDFSFSGNTLSISSAKASHSGQYSCRGKHQKRTPVTTKQAEALKLQIDDNTLKPDIRKDQWFEPFYTGEKIQLDCNMPGDGWKYDWYKGKTDPLITGSTFTINSASPSDTGDYHCTAKRGDFPVNSETLQVRVEDLPEAQVKSDWTEAFPGEKVSLQCVIPKSENWMYMWYQGSEKIDPTDETIIKDNTLTLSVKSSHEGQYACQAELKDRTVKTAKSKTHLLTVHGSKPTVLLKQDPSYQEIYTGERVELTCSIKQKTSKWEYKWQKDSVQVNNQDSHTIRNATLDHHGEYTCNITRREMTFVNSTKLNIREPPQPKLSIGSQWKNFYPNEKVTLKCSIDGDSNEWAYEWFKDGTPLSANKDFSFSGNTLSISSAKASQSGQYSCRGKHLKRTPVTTKQADALKLHIHDNTPKPDIRKDEWFDSFYTGEKIQLGCNMSGDGWQYDWYKGSKHWSRDPTFTINVLSLSDTGDYHCTAKRGDFPVNSESFQVQVEARPPAVLNMETELSDIMAGNILTLRCNVSDGRQWSYAWFENEQRLNESSDVFKVAATEKNIKSEFKCKGIRTERPLYSALSEGFTANNIILKRKILLAISGCVVCCIVILIIGCLVLRITRKPEKKETVPEDLFFSMADSKNQTALPMEEYKGYNSPTEMEECEEKELLTDRVSDVHVDGVIKDEDSPAAEANGLTSFKGI